MPRSPGSCCRRWGQWRSKPRSRRSGCTGNNRKTSNASWTWKCSRPAMRQAWPSVATPPAILTIVSLPRSWRRTGRPRSGVSGIWRQPAERPSDVKVDPSAFTNLADNLSAAWNAPGVTMRARQQLLRTLITEIVVDVKRVVEVVFDDNTELWTVRTDRGDVVRARFVITAVGALSTANMPPIKGFSSFKGKCYHTSQWPHDGVDFTAKRVGVIVTGATAVQTIPEIAQQAKHLTVFQRTPTFCVPARNGCVDPEVTKARKADYDGIRQRIKDSFFGFDLNFIPKSVLETTPEEREQEFDKMWDTGGFAFWLANYQDMFFSKEANDVIADYLKRKIRSVVNDPAIAEKLTPKTYPYGTKRQPLDTNYF